MQLYLQAQRVIEEQLWDYKSNIKLLACLGISQHHKHFSFSYSFANCETLEYILLNMNHVVIQLLHYCNIINCNKSKLI